MIMSESKTNRRKADEWCAQHGSRGNAHTRAALAPEPRREDLDVVLDVGICLLGWACLLVPLYHVYPMILDAATSMASWHPASGGEVSELSLREKLLVVGAIGWLVSIEIADRYNRDLLFDVLVFPIRVLDLLWRAFDLIVLTPLLTLPGLVFGAVLQPFLIAHEHTHRLAGRAFGISETIEYDRITVLGWETPVYNGGYCYPQPAAQYAGVPGWKRRVIALAPLSLSGVVVLAYFLLAGSVGWGVVTVAVLFLGPSPPDWYQGLGWTWEEGSLYDARTHAVAEGVI